MSCDCHSKIEKRLLDRFKELAPEAKNHQVMLTGYTLLLGKSLCEIGFMELKATAEHPLKKGGFKEKTSKENMLFNYCPFCGKSYKAEESPKNDSDLIGESAEVKQSHG